MPPVTGDRGLPPAARIVIREPVLHLDPLLVVVHLVRVVIPPNRRRVLARFVGAALPSVPHPRGGRVPAVARVVDQDEDLEGNGRG